MTATFTIDVHDWDFLVGRWNVRHHRLKARLAGSTEWEEFDGTCVNWPTLGGEGNVDDNMLELPGGTYCAVGIRALDAKAGHWLIWWLDARNPTIDRAHAGRLQGRHRDLSGRRDLQRTTDQGAFPLVADHARPRPAGSRPSRRTAARTGRPTGSIKRPEPDQPQQRNPNPIEARSKPLPPLGEGWDGVLDHAVSLPAPESGSLRHRRASGTPAA